MTVSGRGRSWARGFHSHEICCVLLRRGDRARRNKFESRNRRRQSTSGYRPRDWVLEGSSERDFINDSVARELTAARPSNHFSLLLLWNKSDPPPSRVFIHRFNSQPQWQTTPLLSYPYRPPHNPFQHHRCTLSSLVVFTVIMNMTRIGLYTRILIFDNDYTVSIFYTPNRATRDTYRIKDIFKKLFLFFNTLNNLTDLENE